MNRKPLSLLLVFSLAVLVLVSLQAAVSKAPEAPQWEYKIVAMQLYPVGRNEEGHTSLLNQLGSEGWELVPIDGLKWDANNKALVFRRPLSR